MAEFMTKVTAPVKRLSHEALTNAIHGVRNRRKVEMDPDKRWKLKTIGRELCWLRDQLT